MMGRSLLALCTLISIGVSVARPQGNDLEMIRGNWVIVTDHRLGDTVTITRVFAGYDAFFSWWGETAITDSHGEHNSHIKITGHPQGVSASCFYDISMLSRYDMVWAQRFGDSAYCPTSVEFKKDNADEIKRHLDNGTAENAQQKFDIAIADFNAALALDPANDEALNGLGYAYQSKTDYDEAISKYSSAIVINGNIARYHVNLCETYFDKSKYREALASSNDAIKLDRNMAAAYACRAFAYSGLNEWDESLSDRRKAMELAPDDPDAKDWYEYILSKTHMVRVLICNAHQSGNISVIVHGVRDKGSEVQKLDGWYVLPPDTCKSAGSFVSSGGLSYYAFSDDKEWHNSDGIVGVCAPHNRVFDSVDLSLG